MSLGFVDKRRTQGQKSSPVATPANYVSEAAMDARLTAVNATYYTATRLRSLTYNDKVAAVRAADDAAGI